MGRVYLDDQAEANLQEPVIKALEAYFKQAYTPDSEYGSVSTIATTEHEGQLVVMTAFFCDEKYLPPIKAFMDKNSEQLAAIVHE